MSVNYDFVPFASAVAEQFVKMQNKTDRAFLSVENSDQLWDLYLSSFPEGTNPIHVTRTLHDCSCCRSFVKNVGTAVQIEGSELITIWDNYDRLEYPFNIVAKAMSEYIKGLSPQSLYCKSESRFGAKVTRQLIDKDVKNWNHFYGELKSALVSNSVGEKIGKYNAKIGVFRRGLEEISVSAIDTVLELISEKLVYRGEEFKTEVESFRVLKTKYDKINSGRDLFVWANADARGSYIKNSVIGTLLIDLSSGVDIEKAVRSFEAKVAPENYKRPKALVTPKMMEEAIKQIQESGIEESIYRRLANIHDLSVNDVLFVDNSEAPKMKDGLDKIRDMVKPSLKTNTVDMNNAREISILDFMRDIVPLAETIEAYVENSHATHFSTITAPIHENVPNMFDWDNNFAWAYTGDLADSTIKQRVKLAGGNTDAKLRVSLSWKNLDDLDIHAYMSKNIGDQPIHIYFGNKAGILDVDMNVSNPRRDAVENLSWANPTDGKYVIKVENYNRRENTNIGFEIEFQFGNIIKHISYEHRVSNVSVIEFVIKSGQLEAFKLLDNALKSTDLSQDIWGIKTNMFTKVRTMCYSPNYWGDNAKGNKHWFFILDGCKTDTPIRGFYNEFLNSRYMPNRKFFELLSGKTMCEPVEDQLSGLGFSSTKNSSLVVRISGNRLYKILF